MTPAVLVVAKLLDLTALPHPSDAASGNIVKTIISIVIQITAAICLLMITIAGFRYIVSQGDPQAVGKAKNAIIFALVGLIITILAQGLVLFVFKSIS